MSGKVRRVLFVGEISPLGEWINEFSCETASFQVRG